jgi:HlyD family secretion protein
MDGAILQKKVRHGQYAQCGPMADPPMIFDGGRELHVRADVDEEDAWRVKAGARAVAHVRGNSRDAFPLEFVRFEPYVIAKKSLTGDATERVDTRVLQVIYRFQDQKAPVFNGQQMDVFINALAQRDRNEKHICTSGGRVGTCFGRLHSRPELPSSFRSDGATVV